MIENIFKQLFGKDNIFKGGTPVVNMFFNMETPKEEEKKSSTLKEILASSKRLESGQPTTQHGGGS